MFDTTTCSFIRAMHEINDPRKPEMGDVALALELCSIYLKPFGQLTCSFYTHTHEASPMFFCNSAKDGRPLI